MEELPFKEVPKSTLSRLESLSSQELIQKYCIVEAELERVLRENYELRQLRIKEEQLRLLIAEQLESLKEKEYGVSSERYKKPQKKEDKDEPKTPPKPRVKRPSERYPHIPVREQIIGLGSAPNCPCCNKPMMDSGMTEDSEQLTVIPKKYEILRQRRVKYRCSCQGTILTPPPPPRIIPGSSFSDEMIEDVALSKYCDLIPLQRYAAMAARGGLKDLPPQSLIELTHQYADFLAPAYVLVKLTVMGSRVLHADETPHRMLEGSDKKTWYLWGFSTPHACFLECHGTRSGDVASDILQNSKCEVLVSDVYSGYGKAVRLSNLVRQSRGLPLIRNSNCNAHARRYFFKCWPKYKEAEFYLDHYHEIYQLNDKTHGKPPPETLELRARMAIRFEEMKRKAWEELPSYPEQGKYGKALRYYLDNYEGLTLFLTDAEVPIDNNSQERLLRGHVVGRKTWYGTHSQRGALTAAILFTLVETCKLNQVNAREYFRQLTQQLLAGNLPFTPKEFKSKLVLTQ